MFVNVSVKLPVGVHKKLLVAFISNEPSLSVVTVPFAGAEKVLPPEITWVPENVLVPLELMFPEIMTELEKVLVPE
jgi:hypothetical protein